MDPEQRAAVRTEQAGDQSYGTVAGGNAEIHGADPALLARALGEMQQFLRDYTFKVDMARETTLKELSRELRGMRGETDVVRDSVQKIQARLNSLVDDHARDQADRLVRQHRLDALLLAILRWLIALTIAGALTVAVLALAYAYRLPPFDAAALGRLWLGASAAIATQLRRP